MVKLFANAVKLSECCKNGNIFELVCCNDAMLVESGDMLLACFAVQALSFGALISATDPVTTLAIFEQLQA